MTSTLTPTGPPTAPQPGPPSVASGTGSVDRPGRRSRPERRDTLRLPAEATLVALTIATALGFGRLFTDGRYQGPVLLFALASHGLAIAMRRRRVPFLVAALISTLALLALGGWVFYQSTTRLGLPSGPTLDALRTDLGDALERFRAERAPTEAAAGFVVVSAAIVWVVAFVSDWAAWRLKAPFEATIPAGALFVFVSVLARGRSAAFATVLFFLAVTLFLLLHRASRQEISPAWVRGDGTRGVRALVGGGIAILVVALVAGALVGPFLPGARSEAVIDLRGVGNDSGLRVTVSPLVDIRQRLVNQRDVSVFTVTSPTRSYWRLTALDEFDGRVWRSSKRFEKVDGGALDSSRPIGGSTIEVEQTFEISGLQQIWLPAAYEAADVEVQGRTVRWEPETSTLIVDKETSDGLRYQVTSAVTSYSPRQLDAAVAPAPADISDRFRVLPTRLSPDVGALAQQIVRAAGATTPYRQALALQNYFRDNYTYSTEVTGGQGIDRIEQFLASDVRQGYCEQFAGAFAAMARTLGLPSRVAVGFTPGEPDPADPNRYRVQGRHAHAWPEVYLSGYGWVLFEPTPGRGAPGATSYTNVPERQDSDSAPSGVLETTTTTAVDPTATSASVPDLPAGVGEGSVGDAMPDAAAPPTPAETVRRTTGVLGIVIVVLVVAYLAGMILFRRRSRANRRRGATTNARKVDAAWADAIDALALLGVRPEPADTPGEFAIRAGNRGKCRAQVEELADLATAARYSGHDLTDDDTQRARTMQTEIAVAVRGHTNGFSRTLADIDPRALLHSARAARRRASDAREAQRDGIARGDGSSTRTLSEPDPRQPERQRRSLSGTGRTRL